MSIPLNDSRNGEEAPRAYIVPTQGANARADDIVTFLNSKVSKAKRLSGGVKFVDQIPKNPVSLLHCPTS